MKTKTAATALVIIALGGAASASVTTSGGVSPATDPSTWNSSTDVTIGSSTSHGWLTVNNGSKLTTETAYLSSHPDYYGSARVTGAGSEWTSPWIYAGMGGADSDGWLQVDNGAKVTSIQGVYLANDTGSFGYTTVKGENSVLDAGNLWVGCNGQGRLTIEDGALVKANNLRIDLNSPTFNSIVQITMNGTLAISGDYDAGLSSFLGAIGGTSQNIDFQNDGTWRDITAGTRDEDYTLTYHTTGDLTGYTALSVIPEPASILMITVVAGVAAFIRRRFLT